MTKVQFQHLNISYYMSWDYVMINCIFIRRSFVWVVVFRLCTYKVWNKNCKIRQFYVQRDWKWNDFHKYAIGSNRDMLRYRLLNDDIHVLRGFMIYIKYSSAHKSFFDNLPPMSLIMNVQKLIKLKLIANVLFCK